MTVIMGPEGVGPWICPACRDEGLIPPHPGGACVERLCLRHASAAGMALRPEFIRDMAALRRRHAAAKRRAVMRAAARDGLVAIVAGIIGGLVALSGFLLLAR